MNSKPSALEPNSPRRRPALVRMMFARLTVLSVLFLALETLGHKASLSFYLFFALAFVLVAAYAPVLRDARSARQNSPLPFLVDAFLATGLIHFTGGIVSPLVLLYPLVILAAGIVVSGEYAIKISLLCFSLYAILILLEMQGALDYFGPPPSPYTDPARVLQISILRFFVLAFFTAISRHIAPRLHPAPSPVETPLEILACTNMAPLLLCFDRRGRILYANPAAATFLGRSRASLTGRNIDELVSGLDREQFAGKTALHAALEFRKADGSRLRLPGAVVRLSTNTGPVQILEQGRPLTAEPPIFVLSGCQWLCESEENPPERDARGVPLSFLSECRHSLINSVGAVQMAAEAFLDTLDVSAGKNDLSPQERTLLTELAKALSMGTEQLQEKVETLFGAPSSRPVEQEVQNPESA